MPATANDNFVSLSQIVAILRRRRVQILVTFFIMVTAVIVVTLTIPKQYQTHMKVLVKNERADMVVSPDRNDTAGIRGEVSEADINSEIEILNSTDLLQQVVTKCALAGRQDFADSAVNLERAVKRLQRDLTVSPVRKSNVILVEYSDNDRHTAVTVLRTLADLYLEQHLKIHGTPGSYEFFKTQAERYQQELQDAEAKVAALRQHDNIVMPTQQKEVALQKAAEAQSALNQADAEISEHTQEVVDLQHQIEAVTPRVVTQTRTSTNNYSVDHLQTMLVELQNHRTQLLAKFQPDDRSVKETEQEIADTQSALEKAQKLTGEENSTDVNPIYQALRIDLAKEEAALAGAESRRSALARQSGIYRQQLLTLANDSTTFEDLQRTQKEAEDNYGLYTKKTEEARIAESLDKQKIANVAIAEVPIEPHQPSKPNKAIYFTLGTLLAIFLSFGVAFAAEFFRDTIEDPRELEEVTGLPVLARSYGD